MSCNEDLTDPVIVLPRESAPTNRECHKVATALLTSPTTTVISPTLGIQAIQKLQESGNVPVWPIQTGPGTRGFAEKQAGASQPSVSEMERSGNMVTNASRNFLLLSPQPTRDSLSSPVCDGLGMDRSLYPLLLAV